MSAIVAQQQASPLREVIGFMRNDGSEPAPAVNCSDPLMAGRTLEARNAIARRAPSATDEALPAGAERASDLVLLVAGVGFEPTTFGL
jgi:hypothetical protein